MRDPNNQQIATNGTNGSIQVDCTAPTMEAIAEPQGHYYNSAPTFANFGFDDDLNLDLAEYQVDANGWQPVFSGIDTTAWDSDGWTLPGFSGLSEGSHTVYFRVKDDAGNWNGEGTPDTYSWQFYKDTVAPSPPSNFVALPGHDKVHLTWTNPTGDPTFDKVEIRRVSWKDYPQYAAPAPPYPANNTVGDLVVQTNAESYDDDPVNPRDIYYYAAFAYDLAGNYSSFDSGAADRATNYWLGDIDSTGTVDASDLVTFSGTFGTVDGQGGFIPESDFGPTDDMSRFGIPEPDDVIDFEDLMIFAMNYGNVTPSGTSGYIAASSPVPMSDLVSFKILAKESDGKNTTIAIMLENKSETLKGIHLIVDYGLDNNLVSVKQGHFLSGKGEHFFGVLPAEKGKLDINVAALGIGKPIEGSGEIATIVLDSGTGKELSVKFEKIDIRDINNVKEEIIVGDDFKKPFIPSISSLFQNYPNPFNPTTTITYDVANSGRVTLSIYDVTGRLVCKLVDRHQEPGRYSVDWNGTNAQGVGVPAGIYFYRIKTADYTSSARKMVLIK